MISTLVNGVSATSVDVHDRGLHYGDGVFETFAVRNGVPSLWDMHMQRLMLSCQRLNFPELDPALLWSEAMSLLRSNADAGSGDAVQGVLKIIITRGSGGRGYRAPPPSATLVMGGTTRILTLYPWPEYPATFWSEGVAVRVCATRLGCNPALAGIKHLNRLEQVLARSEWDDVNVPEGVMLDTQGNVIEGTMTNLFVVRNGQMLTPDVSQCGVAGIMRGWILAHARAVGIPATITALTLDTVTSADEVFVCNSVIGLWPVRDIRNVNDITGCSFQVNGPITLGIMAKLRDS